MKRDEGKRYFTMRSTFSHERYSYNGSLYLETTNTCIKLNHLLCLPFRWVFLFRNITFIDITNQNSNYFSYLMTMSKLQFLLLKLLKKYERQGRIGQQRAQIKAKEDHTGPL